MIREKSNYFRAFFKYPNPKLSFKGYPNDYHYPKLLKTHKQYVVFFHTFTKITFYWQSNHELYHVLIVLIKIILYLRNYQHEKHF